MQYTVQIANDVNEVYAILFYFLLVYRDLTHVSIFQNGEEYFIIFTHKKAPPKPRNKV